MTTDGNEPLSDASSAPESPRVRRGRAVLVGVGLDGGDGHFRATTGEQYQLLGGSAPVHDRMRAHAGRLLAEIRRRGFRLDNLTRAEADEISALIESFAEA